MYRIFNLFKKKNPTPLYDELYETDEEYVDINNYINIYYDDNNQIRITRESFYVLLLTKTKTLDECILFMKTFPKDEQLEFQTCINILNIYIQEKSRKYTLTYLLSLKTPQQRAEFMRDYYANIFG